MMYSSLYSVILPMIEANATGTLSLRHSDGKNAEIFLSDGEIVGCRNGELAGEQAAKMVAKWLNFDYDLLEDDIPVDRHGVNLDEKAYIHLLNKIQLIVAQVNKLVSHSGVRLKIQTDDFQGKISMKYNELKVVALLNGKRTIDQVLSESGVSEFELVYTIYKINGLGLIKKVGSHKVMEDAERATFLDAIDEKLSDIVGPAAMVITKEALNTMGTEEEYLSWQDAGKLTDAVAGHLDGEEKEVFKDWWNNNPLRRKTIDF